MDNELANAIDNALIGWAVLYGGGSEEIFMLEDGWTIEQVRNFSDSVEGIIASIISYKTITLDEVFGD